MQTNIAKQFVLQLGSLASLYLSLSFFLVLVFGMITLALPDSLDSSWQIQSATNSVRIGFAMTVVFFPVYLWLTRTVNENRRRSDSGQYLGITRWLIYLSLLVGAGVLLVDLVVVIFGYLEGEMSMRFALKSAAVLIVIGSACMYYLKDAQGYWLERQWASILYGTIGSMIILGTLIGAVNFIETPTEVRERKIDEQQLQDLRDMQWAIQDYLQLNNELPATVADAYQGATPPTSPESRAAYRYEITETGFSLCATFTTASMRSDLYQRSYNNYSDAPFISEAENWQYEIGDWCFIRTVIFPETE